MAYDGYLGRSKLIPIGSLLRASSWASLLWGEGASAAAVEWRLSVGTCGVGVPVFLGVPVCLDESVFLGVGAATASLVGSPAESC